MKRNDRNHSPNFFRFGFDFFETTLSLDLDEVDWM